MVREIKVRNASIYADLDGNRIDFEIRTTKNSAKGLSLSINGIKLLDIDSKNGKLVNGLNYDNTKVINKTAADLENEQKVKEIAEKEAEIAKLEIIINAQSDLVKAQNELDILKSEEVLL